MTVARDTPFEREATYEAAKGAVDPSRLIAFAEVRAAQPHGYVTDTARLRQGVDWLREAREELADARNDLCWWLFTRGVDDDRAPDVMVALRSVCVAFDRLDDIRD